MFARTELVPTTVERAQRYYKGIDLGGILYEVNAADIPGDLPDPERHRNARPNDTEGPFSGHIDLEGSYFEPTDTDGSEPEGGSGRRRVRFTLLKQPRPRGNLDPEGGSGSPRRRSPVRFTLPRQPRAGGDSRGGDP